jgi:hypothetical protein
VKSCFWSYVLNNKFLIPQDFKILFLIQNVEKRKKIPDSGVQRHEKNIIGCRYGYIRSSYVAAHVKKPDTFFSGKT